MPLINPYKMLGMFSIPFDIASAIGYVNSTASPFPIGPTGIPEKPIIAVLIAKKVTLPDGSVYYAARSDMTPTSETMRRLSLNLWY
jgi:hypothetical protein